MRQLTPPIYRLFCCGCAMLYIVACAATPLMPIATQTLGSAQRPNLTAGKSALAIFPWSITGGYHGDKNFAEPEGLKALERALRETDFIPTHSFYRLEERELQRLTRKKFPTLRRVWQGHRLNVDAIVRLGTEIGVKAVFVYEMEVRFSTDMLQAYLIDISSQKIYEAKGETEDFAEESYDVLFGLASEVFTAYARDRN